MTMTSKKCRTILCQSKEENLLGSQTVKLGNIDLKVLDRYQIFILWYKCSGNTLE